MNATGEQSMTIAEMTGQFAGEWILVNDPQTSAMMEVLSGIVLYHSKDRDEVYSRAVTLHLKRCAVLFTGEMAANTAVVL